MDMPIDLARRLLATRDYMEARDYINRIVAGEFVNGSPMNTELLTTLALYLDVIETLIKADLQP